MIAKKIGLFFIIILLFYGCKLEEYKQVKVRDSVELCEVENPNYDPIQECQKIINQRYPSLNCSPILGPTDYNSFGSCRNCTIECSQKLPVFKV